MKALDWRLGLACPQAAAAPRTRTACPPRASAHYPVAEASWTCFRQPYRESSNPQHLQQVEGRSLLTACPHTVNGHPSPEPVTRVTNLRVLCDLCNQSYACSMSRALCVTW